MLRIVLPLIISLVVTAEESLGQTKGPTYNFNFYHEQGENVDLNQTVEDAKKTVEKFEEQEPEEVDEDREEETKIELTNDHVEQWKFSLFARTTSNSYKDSEEDGAFFSLDNGTDYAFELGAETSFGLSMRFKGFKFLLGASLLEFELKPNPNYSPVYEHDRRTIPVASFNQGLHGTIIGFEYDPVDDLNNGIGLIAGITFSSFEEDAIDNHGIGTVDIDLSGSNIYMGPKMVRDNWHFVATLGYGSYDLEIKEFFDGVDYSDTTEGLSTSGVTLNLDIAHQF
jgi:hypothetical protein